MRKSRFSDEKILAIVKEGESGRKVADLVRAYGITEQRTAGGRRSTAAWSSASGSV